MEIVCFSHLRWDFVFQRPQHLLTRFADHFRIFYIEEPLYHADHDHYSEAIHNNIHIIKLHLTGDPHASDASARQKSIIASIFTRNKIKEYILWFYTPMALGMTEGLKPEITVYDCMDELSAFKFAPPALRQMEKELLNKADVVFTGGYSLYEAKKHQHRNIHAFPSSIDKKHFITARTIKQDQPDQANIPHPRFGFYGVLDERFDIELIREVATKKPEWHFVLLGPVVKIDPATLPNNPNIHYLGSKKYNELPAYLGGWDISMVSFAMNESTKFISPTKTPEYLAGGKPVISTPIKDVVESYGKNGLVHIINNSDEFVQVAEKELSVTDKREWLKQVDKCLSGVSWDNTVRQMRELIYSAIAAKQPNIEHHKKENYAAHYRIVNPPALPAAS
jgi:glycosyltransferase involved in cell wall biosynthesis